MQKKQESQSASKQKEEKDFYIDEQGNVVFTKAFLLRRGFCCSNGCKHCPYKNSLISPGFSKGDVDKSKKNAY